MKCKLTFYVLIIINYSICPVFSATGQSQDSLLVVRRCNAFEITGKGDNPEWNKTTWNVLTKLDDGGRNYESKFRILYASTGIYLFFYGDDDKITTEDYQDFGNIFNGDVFEVFFHPDPSRRVYYEYEVNHLSKELILVISNLDGQNYSSWVPRNPDGRSGVKKVVNIVGGERAINSKIKSWTAEIFFPFGSLGLLPHVPPKSGSIWNANFCRLDYDSGKMIKWSWTPTIKNSFHELDKFRGIKFE